MKQGISFDQALRQCSLFLCILFFSSGIKAQVSSGINSDGRDFFIGSVFPSFNKNADDPKKTLSFYKASVLISAYQDTKVYISYFDSKTGKESPSQSFSVVSKNTIQVSLDSIRTRLTEPGDIAEFKSCHITADAPVNVQYFSTGANSGGSYLALPTNALGKQYVVPTYTDNPGYGAAYNSGGQGENAGGFFEIIAPFDSTHVTIIPNGTTAGGHAGANTGKGSNGVGKPYSVSLRRGQCYWVKGDGSDDGNDLSASIVASDKPVALLAGHEDAFLGDVGTRFLDTRDFMIEEIIPWEFADTTGYVSIPLKDSNPVQPEDEGYGENYRVYTFDPQESRVELMWSGLHGIFDMWTIRLKSPPSEKNNIVDPVNFFSTNGRKFTLMMYDNRGQGTSSPFPAESMMSIIPMSRWKSSYFIYVPENKLKMFQNYYFNLICLTNDIDHNFIEYSFNGGSLTPLTSLSSDGTYTNIPYHPELKGVRYPVKPGSYYFRNTRDAYKHPFTEKAGDPYQATPEQVAADTTVLHGAFMIYNYGFRGIDGDMDLGDFDGDDFFFSYANPAGASFSINDSAKLSLTVDSLCGKWRVCARDMRKNNPGIRSIILLNDLESVQCSSPKSSVNCHLDQSLDPRNVGEAELPGLQSDICFDVFVERPIDTAYASLLVTDNAGNFKEVEFHYSPTKLTISPSLSSITIPSRTIGEDTCIAVIIKNPLPVPQIIDEATIGNLSGFHISSVSRSLPVSLQTGDSLTITICFSPRDTLRIFDTLHLMYGCLTEGVEVSGQGETGLITAFDLNFGKADTGRRTTHTLAIWNIGKRDFTLRNNWTITGSKAFSLAKNQFPKVLPVNNFLALDINYVPTAIGPDTAIIEWSTDISAPFTKSVKSYSLLIGEGKAGVQSAVDQHKPVHPILVRPNPAGGQSIILTIDPEKDDQFEVHIYDLLGRERYQKNFFSEGKVMQQLEIPIRELENGIYYARISYGGKIQTEKFEVRR